MFRQATGIDACAQVITGASRRVSTEDGLHVGDFSQVVQQLVQRVLFVRRNGLQVLQKQLRKSKKRQNKISALFKKSLLFPVNK